MNKVIIITPVKDSIESTLETISAVDESVLTTPHSYVVYNDFSNVENRVKLEDAAKRYGFELIHLEDITTHPSPNYLLTLCMARDHCLEQNAGLIIVESDVVVQPHTLQALIDGACERPDCGIAAAVTVDEQGQINYPYEYARGHENVVIDNKRHCSFCCSLLTPELLKRFDFNLLDSRKSWHDVTISHKSIDLGLHNYLFTNLPVLHRPHSSRPWKKLKYSNPLLYYWRKFTKGLDKI